MMKKLDVSGSLLSDGYRTVTVSQIVLHCDNCGDDGLKRRYVAKKESIRSEVIQCVRCGKVLKEAVENQ